MPLIGIEPNLASINAVHVERPTLYLVTDVSYLRVLGGALWTRQSVTKSLTVLSHNQNECHFKYSSNRTTLLVITPDLS